MAAAAPAESKKAPKRVAVFGVTGFVGSPVALALRKDGHAVFGVTRKVRKDHEKQKKLLEAGVQLLTWADQQDFGAVTKLLRENKIEIVITAMFVFDRDAFEFFSKLHAAALASGTVRRYVPSEFGLDTRNNRAEDIGDLAAKQRLHPVLKAKSKDMAYTLIYNGCYSSYFIPNRRFFDRPSLFGNVEGARFPTHLIEDVAAVVARIVVDPRTANAAVQIAPEANIVTQAGLLKLIRRVWAKDKDIMAFINQEPFVVSSEEVTRLSREGDNGGGQAKAGNESERLRMIINRVITVDQTLWFPDDKDTLQAAKLYPDFQFKTPEEIISSREFMG